MANKARGEVTLELGGDRYVLKPEFGVIAKLEDALDSSMFQLGLKADRLDFNAKELVRTLRAILEANGYEVEEERLIEAIAKQGAAAALVPLIAFVGAYVWGGQGEKKAAEETPSPETAQSGETRSAST